MSDHIKLGLQTNVKGEQIYAQGYLYRAIATNQEDRSDHLIVHWYTQHGKTAKIGSKNLSWILEVMPCRAQTSRRMLCTF
jgi:hypothetical protein